MPTMRYLYRYGYRAWADLATSGVFGMASGCIASARSRNLHLNHGSAWLSIRYFSARLPAGGLSLAIL